MSITHDAHSVEVISRNEPTENDWKETEALKQFMRDKGLYESNDEFHHRVEVLNMLLDLVRKWVKRVAERRGLSETDIEDANANIYSFGSFRLNAHGPGDDIDTHCIGPSWCDRQEDFFGDNEWCLEAMLQAAPWVDELSAVRDAYVPVLKLEIKGVDIDLTYAQLPTNDVPAVLDLQDNNLLRGMDEVSVTSINGCRVTDKIVQLIEKSAGKGLTAFQDALRFLKYWGKKRGIYSNVMGFLGGVNFAILVTRVCLHWPNASASMIVRKFFSLYTSWSWAEGLPVMVAGIDREGPMGHMVWNRQKTMMHGGHEIFPIITPCYPASNSTFNVSECTKSIMLEEFERGKRLLGAADVRAGQLADYHELTEAFNFLGPGSFANYLQVVVAASSREDFGKWSGFMNSRVKHLTSRLHNTQGQLLARPWPKEFPIPMELCEDGRRRTSWIIGLRRQPLAHAMSSKRIDIRTTISDFRTKCENWPSFSIGMTIEVNHIKHDALPEYLQPYAKAEAEAQEKIASARAVKREAAEAAEAERRRAAEALQGKADAAAAGEATPGAAVVSAAEPVTDAAVAGGAVIVKTGGNGADGAANGTGSLAEVPVGQKRKFDDTDQPSLTRDRKESAVSA